MPTHTAGRGRRSNALFRGAPRIRRPFDRYGASNAPFFMGFGFQAEAWETLGAALREHGQQHEVTLTKETGCRPRFEVEGELAAPDGRRPQVRTVWQQDAGEIAPRLITAYSLESR